MNLWDTTRDHSGWLVSAAAAAAGYLLRRRGRASTDPDPAPTARHRLSPSRIGEFLNAVKEKERLRAELTGLEESTARREAVWAMERAEMEAYATRIQTRASELARLVETLRTVQGAASSSDSAPPSTPSTVSAATSSPPSPKPNR